MATPDPWFQPLFAERIGGVNYGKGTEIYKFEKIKRAKRAVLAAHPERAMLDFVQARNAEHLADRQHDDESRPRRERESSRSEPGRGPCAHR